MTGDIANCAERVLSGDPDRFLSAMTARTGADRDALMVLYAFNVEVSRAPWVTKEPLIAEMRLQWWLDVIEEVFADGEVRAHEVATPLAALIRQRDLPRAPFDALINARQWDIYDAPFTDDAALAEHFKNTGGALMGLAVQALGGGYRAAESYGSAIAVANWLRAVPQLVAAKKYPLVDGRDSGVKTLAKAALRDLQTARRAARKMPRSTRAALRAGWLAAPVLRVAAAFPERVAIGELEPSEFGKKFRLLRLSAVNSF